MKIMTVIGARPQFIKCAPVSRCLRKCATEILVHTGQHYDLDMSDCFFHQLQLPEPNYNLGIGSATHAKQTGEMLIAIENLLLQEKPEVLLVYGDTNSTLAGALAAAKLQIPIAHVEAGLRSFNSRMPEELNRILTDHVSSRLFCPTNTAVDNLAREGITNGVQLVGDVMFDALWQHHLVADSQSTILQKLTLSPKSYFLATIHRAENTDNLSKLVIIIETLLELSRSGTPVVLPLHPRTRKKLAETNLDVTCSKMILTRPVSYIDKIKLESNAKAILTDSGGVQKEAFWLSVPCVTLRDETEWVETVASGWNFVAGVDRFRILRYVYGINDHFSGKSPVGEDGHAAERIVASITSKSCDWVCTRPLGAHTC